MSNLIKEINVNKNVVITDTYTAGESRWGGQDYLNITAVDGDSKSGFVNAVFAFDGNGQCCEQFGVDYDDRLFGNYFVRTIKVYESSEPSDKDYGYFEAYGEMIVEVETDIETFIWKCYNDHNGYYGHSIDVEVHEDGRKTFEYENVY